MRAVVPAALLALFAGWCGTFYYGASWGAVVAGHLALLAMAAWGWRRWDPLGLGQRVRVLPPLFYAWLLLSLRCSPVPRAGWLAAALLPAFLALPSAVARCWSSPEARRRGMLAVAAVLAAMAGLALAGMLLQGSTRAAQPLGNTLVLGEVLAMMTPLVLATAFSGTPGSGRWLEVAAVAMGGAALLATRSFAATAAAVVGALLALAPGRRRWALLPLALGTVLLGPRAIGLARGGDISALARRVYWEGGLRAIAAAPWCGHGPGATPWTLAPWLRPIPGVNPPGETVGDLHALGLQLPYELGLPGLLLAAALAVAFVRARRRERPGGEADAALRRGGLAGLSAGLTSLVAGPTLGTTAPYVTLAIVAGAALAAGGERPAAALGEAPPHSRAGAIASPPTAARRANVPLGWLYAALAILLLLPVDAALGFYDAARAAGGARARALLAVAGALDPELPLYRARLGWLAGDAGARAASLQRAASGAPGVAALQLAAGWASQVAGAPGAPAALERACADDPLDGWAPFLLALGSPTSPAAPRLAARALLTNPLLLAAVDWRANPTLRRNAVEVAATWPGVSADFREALVWSAQIGPVGGPLARLRATMDEGEPGISVSLNAFRRLPWRADLAAVTLWAGGARKVALAPASALRETAPDAFTPSCSEAAPRR